MRQTGWSSLGMMQVSSPNSVLLYYKKTLNLNMSKLFLESSKRVKQSGDLKKIYIYSLPFQPVV